ncbi:hypothetical protein ACQPU1_08095 [Clostridium paraputrificum]|uniref:hypothetical protein n=1 Tax=Clostridium paraputrificum TaxID=29363 RepID=UPI003D33D0CD
MPIQVITSIIGAISILAGSLVGALFSWIINRNMHQRRMQEEYKIMEENRKYEEHYRVKAVCNNANVIRLDIATALFQSIRSLQNKSQDKSYLYLLPINREYSSAVASLSDKYDLKELSYLYQLYGIIEKVNRDIYSWSIGDKEAYEKVKLGFNSILYKIYGEDYIMVLKVDADKISYDELYKNDYIRPSYKKLLKKLDDLCVIENLLKEKEDKKKDYVKK